LSGQVDNTCKGFLPFAFGINLPALSMNTHPGSSIISNSYVLMGRSLLTLGKPYKIPEGVEFNHSTIKVQTGPPLILEANASATGLPSK
jgi:hypothetical protein